MKLSSKKRKGREETPGTTISKKMLAREQETTLNSKPDRYPDELIRNKEFRHLLWGGV